MTDSEQRERDLGKAVENDDVLVLRELVNPAHTEECEVLADFAFSAGKPGVARFFLEEVGLENKLQTTSGTLLAAAARSGSLQCVQLLLDKGVDDLGAGLPLVRAAKPGNLEVIRLLVEAGADVNQANPGFPGPLDIAELYGHTEVMDYLRSHGATTQVGEPEPEELSEVSIGELLMQDTREPLPNEALDDGLSFRLDKHIKSLGEAERSPEPVLCFYAARLLEWEVANGGFAQAALNIPEWFPAAAKGYRAIGCEQAAQLVERAMASLPPKPGPIKKLLAGFTQSGEDLNSWREQYIQLNEGALGKLDEEAEDPALGFWAIEARLAYVRSNREVFGGFDP